MQHIRAVEQIKQEIKTDIIFFSEWIPSNKNCTINAWFKYEKNSNTTTSHTYGELGNYHGRGYTINFDINTTNVTVMLEDINTHKWLDDRTRFVAIETTISNPASRLFSMISFGWEVSSYGYINPTPRVTSARLYPYIDAFDFVIMFLQIISILATLIRILIFIFKMWQFQNNIGSYFECSGYLISIVLSVVAICIYIYRIDRSIYTIETIFNNKGENQHPICVKLWYPLSLSTKVFLKRTRINMFETKKHPSKCRYQYTQYMVATVTG